MGIDTSTAHDTIDSLKLKELEDRTIFEEKNPEVNLPYSLDSVFVDEEFPHLSNNDATPVKEKMKETDTTWVQVASKAKIPKSKIVENDRCLLEH